MWWCPSSTESRELDWATSSWSSQDTKGHIPRMCAVNYRLALALYLYNDYSMSLQLLTFNTPDSLGWRGARRHYVP